MKRIAFFGPLTPDNTGIADYDEALLPLLKEHYDIDVFLPYRSNRSQVYPHWEFYFRQKQHPYDLMLYQIGNHAKYHGYILGYAFQFPGATIFHDFCIHHLLAALLIDRGLYSDYREELKAVYPEDAEKIGNAVITYAAGNLLFFCYPFFNLLLRASLAAAAHTAFSVKQLQVENTPVIHIPHLELPARVEVGEDPFPGKFVIASFGFATRAKRVSPVLDAVARLRKSYPNLLYLIAGALERQADLETQIDRLGLKDWVKITGFIEESEFLRMISRADVVLNLRYPSAGEMSGTLIRAMACAKPVLLTRLPSHLEIPEDAAVWIRPDREAEDLFVSLSELIENDSLRRALGAAARRYVDRHHRPENALEKYRELIELAIQRRPTFRKPLLPLHLQSSREILRAYIRHTSFNDTDSKLLDWIL